MTDTKKKRVSLHCSNCDSTNITSDALASFNVATQQWELADLLDNTDCNDCGGKCRVIEKQLDY